VIPCVFSADATGVVPNVVVVVVVVDDEDGDGPAVFDVVGGENISSSCNNKDDIFLVKLQIDKRKKNDSHANCIFNNLKLVTDERRIVWSP